MTIFVERSLVQLNAQALEELVSHLKLNYTAVIAEESQLYIFEEVIHRHSSNLIAQKCTLLSRKNVF